MIVVVWAAERIGALSRNWLHRWAALVNGSTPQYDCQIHSNIVVETFMQWHHRIAAHPEIFERAYPARLTNVEDAGRVCTAVNVIPQR
jgi:hypothetical protein